MPRFEYDAIDVAGEQVTGAMEARSAEAVFERLQALGHLAIDAREISGAAVARGRRWLRWPRALSGEITLFTRELSMMLAAGHQLDHALEVLAEGAGTPEMAALIGGINEEVRGGQSLSAALEPHADRFSKMYVNMVRAGEASGTVNVILERIAEYREASERLRSTVINALYYPAILITASLASVLLLLTFVVPQFEQVFAEAGALFRCRPGSSSAPASSCAITGRSSLCWRCSALSSCAGCSRPRARGAAGTLSSCACRSSVTW